MEQYFNKLKESKLQMSEYAKEIIAKSKIKSINNNLSASSSKEHQNIENIKVHPVHPINTIKSKSCSNLRSQNKLTSRTQISLNIIPVSSLYNTFLKVNDKFEITFDKNALKQVVEYRSGLFTHGVAGDMSNLNTNPYPPSAKIMPLNVQELEYQLNQNSKHSTFHTNSKIIKEIEVSSDHSERIFKHEVTQEEKLAYQAYCESTSKPDNFVEFIIKLRKSESKQQELHSIYQHPKKMSYFNQLSLQSKNYRDVNMQMDFGSLNSKLLKSKYVCMNV